MKLLNNLIVLSACLLISACSKDLGNYTYQDINELKIKGLDDNYIVRTQIDTLRISPVIEATIDESDPSRYEYFWITRRTSPLVIDTISRERNLVYPVELDIVPYGLYYRVRDKETGVTWVANSSLTVGTAYARGLLIMGEDEQGFAEAEMLSMLPDTIHMKNILSDSGLPPLREPVSFMHSAGSEMYIKLWAMTRTGSYYLDRMTMKATASDNLNRILFTSENLDPEGLQPIVFAPQVRTAAGLTGSTLYRAMVTSGGDIFACVPLLMGGDYYNNPVNRLEADPQNRLVAAPYLLYPINSMNSVIWYDQQNNRFMNFTNFIGSFSELLVDRETEDDDNYIFPWNQPVGRTLVYAENTRNTDGGSTNGNSFAIMKDVDNTHHVYKFYANGANPVKRAAYIVSSIATDFDKADHYAFSSNRSVIFYAVGNKLFAYDYNPGLEKLYTFPEIAADEITMLKFDTQIDHVSNSLYIATYNAETKGTLSRYLVGTNPNIVELISPENSTWSGMIKIKDVNWRAGN